MRAGNGFRIIPSEAYVVYEEEAGYHLRGVKGMGIDFPVNVECKYYMPSLHRVDLVNLLEATDDILVHYGVLKDDNFKIIAGHDGSRVLLDRKNPRVVIVITEVTDAFNN